MNAWKRFCDFFWLALWMPLGLLVLAFVFCDAAAWPAWRWLLVGGSTGVLVLVSAYAFLKDRD